MTLADVVDLLACPSCAAREVTDSPLGLDAATLRCPHGHAYDVARQGHVNLLGRAVPRNADAPAMVAARERFLGSGAYDRVADALGDAVLGAPRLARPGTSWALLDVGAGPGWYLDRVLGRFEAGGSAGRGVALDVSPAAARRAARSSRAVGAVVADAWGRLPVRSAAVDAVLSVFAPRQPAELARVLAAEGTVVVVSPLPEHLVELREAWGLLDVEEGKQDRIGAAFGEHLAQVGERDVRYRVPLDVDGADDLVGMGPNAFHHRTGPARPVPPGEVTVAVRVGSWRRRG